MIDALFGAGLARDIDGEAKTIIERVNAFARAGGRVLAVDVPSGVDGGTGKVRGVAVEASASVTFFRLKPGHLLCRGACSAGRSGSPTSASPRRRSRASRRKPSSTRLASGARRCRAPTPKATNTRRGAVLVLSGAAHRTGAARLAARAALRSGAGIVTLASPPDAVAETRRI